MFDEQPAEDQSLTINLASLGLNHDSKEHIANFLARAMAQRPLPQVKLEMTVIITDMELTTTLEANQIRITYTAKDLEWTNAA